MAYFIFTDKYFAGEPIRILIMGISRMIFTGIYHIDDIVEGMVRLFPGTGEES